MIKSITTSDGLFVNTTTPPYINMSSLSAGMIRYNGYDIEVYDGVTWLQITSSADISLDYDTKELLSWARKKRDEEQKIEKLKDNPAIADLLRQRDILDDQLEMVKILLTAGKNTGTHGTN